MEPSRQSIHLELTVRVGSDPIAGELRAAPEAWRPFVGWVALVRSIEEALDAGVRARGGEAR